MKDVLPEVLSKIKSLEIRARIIVFGFLSGIHESFLKGQSLEFSEHRLYSPGDDPRYIDWKAYGRSDKYYLKQFEHYSSVDAYFLLDSSNSMNFGSHSMTKLEYAVTLCSSLMYLFLAQGDRVGIFLPQREKKMRFVKPSRGFSHFESIINLLEGIEPAGELSFSEFVEDAVEKIRRRSFVFIISDLLDDTDKWKRSFQLLKGKKSDLRVLHIVDPVELEFPFSGEIIFKGFESEGECEANARKVKNRYMERMNSFLNFLSEMCTSSGGIFKTVRTDAPFTHVIYDIKNSGELAQGV